MTGPSGSRPRGGPGCSAAAGRLEVSEDEMRRLGYRVIDLVVEHLASLSSSSVGRTTGREALERRLREPLPRAPGVADAVLDQAVEQVLGHILHLDHPRFFAFTPSPSTFVGVLADALVAGFNPFAGTWLEASGPAQVELTTIDWLREVIGLPEEAGGLFVSGGSEANLTALAVARAVRLAGRIDGAMLYASDEAHSSIARAASLLGFRPQQTRIVPTDSAHRIVPGALRELVSEDRRSGRRPFAVVATAGTTNTGAVDPIADVADVSRAEGLWLHVDGAFGAAIAFSPRRSSLLAGIEAAQSVTIDPHKWLFQPYDIGCLLVRDRAWLPQTFRVRPAYLRDVSDEAEEVNFADHGLQLTRSFRALKLWMSLKVFGADAFGAAIDRGVALAETAQAWVEEAPGWGLVSGASLGVVCFRYVASDLSEAQLAALNQEVAERTAGEGHAMVATTLVRGCVALRMCTINPRTSEEDLVGTLARLDRHARAGAARMAAA